MVESRGHCHGCTSCLVLLRYHFRFHSVPHLRQTTERQDAEQMMVVF